ncbi:MAG: AMP-binding protein [Dehalococcoidia bacterium]|jgi:acyl-CoA synthetase (AMP-forming)/AMP-acid ligase II
MDTEFKFEKKKIGNALLNVYVKRPASVYSMFLNTVDAYPQRQAVTFGDISITYAELGRRVDALSSALAGDYKVGKGDRVAMFLKNDDAFPAVFLAISKLGAVSVVHNTRLTRGELEHQLDMTEPVAAIVDAEIWDKGLDKFVKHKIERNSLAEIYAGGGTHPAADCDEEDVHTVLFTSGTTGKAKGVKILHRNFIHSAIRMEQYMREILGFDTPEGGSKTLIVAPLFHVMALQEQLMPCLKMGNTVIMLSALSITAFLEIVEKGKVEFLVGSPAIYRILLGSAEVAKYDLSPVKLAGFGASPMSPDLMSLMKKSFVKAKFFNGFGLTEASVSLVSLDRECIENPTSIGRPSLGCEAAIVDEKIRELPVGTVGEIAIKGPNVAGGYYNDPQATADSFTDGWFLTGDLGKCDENGFFYVVSRKKDMINRGGENIYPVEVENIIYLHPKVLEVAVYRVPDAVMGEKAAASIVAVPNTNLTAEEIQEFCSGKLARYKIPEYIVFTASLPKNPGGKVIKEELTRKFSAESGPTQTK